MKNSPNTRFKLRLRAANGSGLSDIMMTVEKDYTIDYLVQRIIQYFVKTDGLQNDKQKKSRCSKQSDIHSRQKDSDTFTRSWCFGRHKVNI